MPALENIDGINPERAGPEISPVGLGDWKTMNNYRSVLRSPGWVLIALGIIDVGHMIYCIFNRMNYSSSFNIFAIVAGVFLLRGSLKAARFISQYAAFFIAVFAGVIVLVPFLIPPALLLVYARSAPVMAIVTLFLLLTISTLLIWIYIRLTSLAVREAMAAANIDTTSFWNKPATGFWLGGCLILFLSIAEPLLSDGKTANEAKHRAAAKVSSDHDFYVSSIKISSGSGKKHVRAIVTAYNKTEFKNIEVEWDEFTSAR